jgi:hypothetical protein
MPTVEPSQAAADRPARHSRDIGIGRGREGIDATVAGDRFGQLLVVSRLDEFVHQFRGEGVADPVTGLGGGAQTDQQVCLMPTSA